MVRVAEYPAETPGTKDYATAWITVKDPHPQNRMPDSP